MDNHAPMISTNPLSDSVHAGGSVTLDSSLSDPDGDSVTVTITEYPSEGTLTYNAGSGTFTYAAPAVVSGSSGEFTFSYTVTDAFGAQTSGSGSVRVTNNPPMASSDSVSVRGWSNNAPTRPVGASGSGNVLSMASDSDGDSLAASLSTAPSHGTLARSESYQLAA